MTDSKLRRRYVYMSDDEWAWLKQQAGLDATISSVVRSLVDDARRPFSVSFDDDTLTTDPAPAKGRLVQLTTVPAVRPVPKPTRKRR